jgi:RNA polymerase sigma-70 factor (ECF subfamily)
MSVRKTYAGPAEDEQQIQEIVLCAARGDASAFAQLYERYHEYVRNIAYHILHNHEDSEDVAQNVWRKLLLHLNKYPCEVRFSTWLYRVVCNEAIDHTRRLRAYRHVHSDAFADEQDNASTRAQSSAFILEPEQELDLLQMRIREELSHFLERLQIQHPPRALCFELHYLQGVSVEEIAAQTQIAVGTVKSHLYYARKYLSEEHPILFDLYQAVRERLGKSRP